MGSPLLVAVSDIHAGSMSKGVSDAARLANQRRFLQNHDISAEQTVQVSLQYDGNDFRRYHTVEAASIGDGIVRPSSMTADALFTKERSVALLLPIADCIGVVLYDKATGVLGLSHLGRHNLLQDGGSACVKFMVEQFGVDPANVTVYLSPAAGAERYPLFDFDNRGLHEVAAEQLVSAGVLSKNITTDARDTTMDPSLFSHSEYLQGRQATDGRQAVVCMMLSK